MTKPDNKNFWKNKNVFVTGCTGLLGAWLVKYLVDKKANVVGLIRDEVPESNLMHMGLAKKICGVKGELADYYLLKRIINEYEVEVVYHLAAQTIVSVANRDPLSTFESNIKGTWNILEACRNRENVKQIVISSSDKAYGDKEKLPYSETDTLSGSHPYDVSKSCADLIAQAYYKTFNLPVCITRCANLYGGGDLNFSRIIPGTIRSVLNNEPPIIRSDGKYMRDYFYVEDAALALLALVEKMQEKNIYGEAFNFSSEVNVSVLKLVNKILTLMHTKLRLVILNEVKNEIRNQYLSVTKAKKLLNWRSRYDLDSGLIKTIAWYKKYLNK
ncbi:NAD-dependent epimerase/dehydratase family protein [bacterium]|nr:MAG: NAD-dependent epimerase/dehydratase family protein [bacterium]